MATSCKDNSAAKRDRWFDSAERIGVDIYTIGIDVTLATAARIDDCRIPINSVDREDSAMFMRVIDCCMLICGSRAGATVGKLDISFVGKPEDTEEGCALGDPMDGIYVGSALGRA